MVSSESSVAVKVPWALIAAATLLALETLLRTYTYNVLAAPPELPVSPWTFEMSENEMSEAPL